MNFLNSVPARILAGILLLQAAAYYAVASRTELTPQAAPLSNFAGAAGAWRLERDTPLEKEVVDLLKADDTLNRVYVDPRGTEASLFIAFFKTQRFGQSPHSPKNCLPGNGWQAYQDGKAAVAVPGRSEAIVINRYVIGLGDQEDVVLYWYQSPRRIVAGELAAKMWLVADAIRYRRSDSALVRVIVAVRNHEREAAERSAVGFVQAIYPEVARQLPQ